MSLRYVKVSYEAVSYIGIAYKILWYFICFALKVSLG